MKWNCFDKDGNYLGIVQADEESVALARAEEDFAACLRPLKVEVREEHTGRGGD